MVLVRCKAVTAFSVSFAWTAVAARADATAAVAAVFNNPALIIAMLPSWPAGAAGPLGDAGPAAPGRQPVSGGRPA